jgi:hypothetical protein
MKRKIDLAQGLFLDNIRSDPFNKRSVGGKVHLETMLETYIEHGFELGVHERLAHDMEIEVVGIRFDFFENALKKCGRHGLGRTA